jgi:Ser/Thr protein kinase RdoA (MazF antagonist)
MEQKLKDDKIKVLEQQVTLAHKETEIAKQELQLEKRLTEIAQRETEVYRVAFEREKELTDRALKLAEISKPTSDWKMQGLALVAAIIMGIAIGK